MYTYTYTRTDVNEYIITSYTYTLATFIYIYIPVYIHICKPVNFGTPTSSGLRPVYCSVFFVNSWIFKGITSPERMAEKEDRKRERSREDEKSERSQSTQNTPGERNFSSSGIEDVCLKAQYTMNVQKMS